MKKFYCKFQSGTQSSEYKLHEVILHINPTFVQELKEALRDEKMLSPSDPVEILILTALN